MVTTNERQRRQHQRERRPGKQPYTAGEKRRQRRRQRQRVQRARRGHRLHQRRQQGLRLAAKTKRASPSTSTTRPIDPPYTQWKHIVPTGILERHTIDFSSCSSVERASLLGKVIFFLKPPWTSIRIQKKRTHPNLSVRHSITTTFMLNCTCKYRWLNEGLL